MYKPGTIILTPFPFSNLAKHAVRIEKSPQTGLKISSVVRFDKIATLEKNIILGELGKVDDDFFQKYQQKFFTVPEQKLVPSLQPWKLLCNILAGLCSCLYFTF